MFSTMPVSIIIFFCFHHCSDLLCSLSLVILLLLSLGRHRLSVLAALWLRRPLLLLMLRCILLIRLWLHILLLLLLLGLTEGSIAYPSSTRQRRVLELVFLSYGGGVEAGSRAVTVQVDAEDDECYGEEDPMYCRKWLAYVVMISSISYLVFVEGK